MIKQVAIRGYDKNFSYFVYDEGREVFVVDPGDAERLEEVMAEHNWVLKGILLTHSHHDHVEGVAELVERYGVPVYMHRMAEGRVPGVGAEVRLLEDGDRVGRLEVMYTPGHIDDAVCYYDREAGDLLTGDTLFVGGCGRADLPGSDAGDLWESLQRIKKMPGETKIYPGHDYGDVKVSRIELEVGCNRYLMCESLEDFLRERIG